MRVHYGGPVDRVCLPLPNGRVVEVARGESIDLRDHLPAKEADELGRRLAAQEAWREDALDKSAGAAGPKKKEE